MFPEKHSFKYSYLMVGIPVGWEGNSAGMISSANKDRRSFVPGLYHVDPADYLERGYRELGLRGKLERYLRSQVSVFPAVLMVGLY